jgi:hypothetical protein
MVSYDRENLRVSKIYRLALLHDVEGFNLTFLFHTESPLVYQTAVKILLFFSQVVVMTRLCPLPLTLVVWLAILLCGKTNTCSAFAPSSNSCQTPTCPLKFWMAASLNDSSNEPVRQVKCPNCDQCDGSGRSVEIGNLVLVCVRCQLIFLFRTKILTNSYILFS